MEQPTLFNLIAADETDFDRTAAMQRARELAPLPKTAWTGWTFDDDGRPTAPSYERDKVWWLNEYYRDSWDGEPMSGDDTVRAQAWTEAAGYPVRYQLGVNVETGEAGVTDNKGKNVYVLPLARIRAALAQRRARR